MALIDGFSQQTSSILTTLQQFIAAQVEYMLDVDKTKSLIQTVKGIVTLPKRCLALYYKAAALDLLQFHRFADFALNLKLNWIPGESFTEEELQGLCNLHGLCRLCPYGSIGIGRSWFLYLATLTQAFVCQGGASSFRADLYFSLREA